jgi:hypothetical protein
MNVIAGFVVFRGASAVGAAGRLSAVFPFLICLERPLF